MSDPVMDKADKLAENSVVKLLARFSMLAVLPLGGWMGANVWSMVIKTNDAAIRLEEKLQNVVTLQIPSLSYSFDGRFNAQAERLTEHDKRIGKLEDWRNTNPSR